MDVDVAVDVVNHSLALAYMALGCSFVIPSGPFLRRHPVLEMKDVLSDH